VAPFPSALGTLTLAANGSYTYSVANSAVQFLAQNQVKTDTFTVTSVDGTQRQVVFSIQGVNDAPIANPDTNANGPVVETGVNPIGSNPMVAGSVTLNDFDADQGEIVTVTGVAVGNVSGPVSGNLGTALVGTYGTLTLFSGGFWQYQLNDSDPDTNALTDGQVVSDVFSYTVADFLGASATSTLSIAISGVNDAPSSPPIALPVLEGSGQHQLDLLADVTDPEGDAFHVENIAPFHSAFTINPDGSSLTFDANDPAFEGLTEGTPFTVVVGYDLVDDKGARHHQMAAVEVTGVNDAPTVSATTQRILIEQGKRWDVGIADSTTFIDFHDPDSPLELDMTGWADNHNGTWSRAGVYGTATFDGRRMDYNLDSNDADTKALDTGDTVYETFTVTAYETNGSLAISKDTTFEIHGRSDMLGKLITYDYNFPTDQNIFHHDTAFVGGGVEVTEMSPEYSDSTIEQMISVGWVPIGFVGPDPGHVDFTGDQIIFTFDQDWSYNQGYNDFTFLYDGGGHVGPPTQAELDNASNNPVFWHQFAGTPFNGAHISFDSQMPDLTWVELDASTTGAIPGGLRFDHEGLYLDLQDRQYTAGQQIVLNLTFYAEGDWLT
jgi:VCBS repeat-containing protein